MKEFSHNKSLLLSDNIALKYDVKLAMKLLFDDEFGFSNGEISVEEGKDFYYYN